MVKISPIGRKVLERTPGDQPEGLSRELGDGIATAPSLRVVAASPDAVAGEHPIHEGAIGNGNEVLGSVQDEDGSEDAGRSQRELLGSGNRRESANALEVAA